MKTEIEGESVVIRPDTDGHGWESESGPEHWMIAPNDIRYFRMPVYAHFGAGPFHAVEYAAQWDIDDLMKEFAGRLVRSRVVLERRKTHADATSRAVALFRPCRDLFIYCDGKVLIAYAAEVECARTEIRRLASRHAARRLNNGACFKVLEVFARSIETHDVPISRSARHDDAGLALHYGDEFPAWEQWFTGMLRRSRNTISILQGEPGTGKTSFLRHLIVRMRRTHRFYFLPPNEVAFLLRASALGFWLEECGRFPRRPPVLIIEDGEKALFRRGPDNHQDVSNILNVADGLLGQSIRAHVICTVNCPAGDVDPAVTRPGRLLAWRPFRRLTRAEAHRLAGKRRIVIPAQDDYTLADIYHGGHPQPPTSSIRRSGFASASQPVSGGVS